MKTVRDFFRQSRDSSNASQLGKPGMLPQGTAGFSNNPVYSGPRFQLECRFFRNDVQILALSAGIDTASSAGNADICDVPFVALKTV